MNPSSLPPLTGQYDELVLTDALVARACPLKPCGDPLCECRADPSCLFAYGEDGADRWVAGRLIPESGVDALVTMVSADTQLHEPLLANSILFGCSWQHFVGEGFTVLLNNQAAAIARTPSWFVAQPVEQLRALRAAIHEIDPLPVAELLKASHYHAMQTGGERGHLG